MTVADAIPPRALSTTETARDAKRQRAFHSAKDYETSASQLGDIQATETDAKRKAAIVVAAHVPRAEVEEILMMLGIHPSQPDFEDDPITGAPRRLTPLNSGA